MGKLTRRRKGAGGQGIGFQSITAAAAEFSVTFGLWFYRLGARLWGRWGSSCAVWKCRAARCAVPTVYAEAPRPFVGAGHWPARAILKMGKRRVREAAPYRGELPLWRAATWGPPLRQKSDRERWFGKARRTP